VKILNGKELAEFIQERQSHQVRSLVQGSGVQPRLAIIKCTKDPVIETYVRLKKVYGAEIGVEVDVYDMKQANVAAKITELNKDPETQGIIIQLPLADPSQTDEIVNMVAPGKDVDALGSKATLDPATPMAILWLISGYNIDMRGKKIVLVGRGKLVGAPLEKLLLTMGHDVTVLDSNTKDLKEPLADADIIVTATGSPAAINASMIKEGAVVIDAGVASESGKTVGDLAPDVYERDDLTITPTKGGVGPLTVCALFDNVIKAASYTNG
jgi:methylenetetrahydrofolate dehydrogenase (NADP+)/methenyltetrahydrofolate cyclohydrolase